MSDRDFENYLSLLAGLLRLRGKQREAIAEELRSHLEDRLDELVAQGVSRDEAVRQALAEFGDAAGLAGQFLAVSQNRKRRWLMRITTFSIAATLLIAAGLTLLWPGRNAAPGLAVAIAQAPVAPEKAKEISTAPAEESSLQEKLDQRIDFDVVEMPLKTVILLLQDKTGIQFVLRHNKLYEASVSADTEVTKSLTHVRVSTLLDLMLSDLELTYVEKDDLLLITTPEDAEATMEIRVYDCRDLLAMPAPPGADKFVPNPAAAGRSGGMGGMFAVADEVRLAQPASTAQPNAAPAGANASSASSPPGGATIFGNTPQISEHDLHAKRLMQIITTNVDNQSWAEVGGPGSISEFNGLIVVTQTAQTHKKVEHVLNMLREAAGLEVPKTGKVVH